MLLPHLPKRLTLSLFAAVALLAGCINITINFPSAEAEQAADRIVEQVYGKDSVPAPTPAATPATAPTPAPAPVRAPGARLSLLDRTLTLLVPAAQAQSGADLNISTPAIRVLITALEARHSILARYYTAGSVGLTDDGLIALRDIALVPLPERNAVRKLVADENADRQMLYAEIARANQHDEWVVDIRTTFAARWAAKAQAGWWVRRAGTWEQR